MVTQPETNKEKAAILRGTVNGKSLYCRVPIRRKRVPIFADEFRDMLDAQDERGISDSDVTKMAQDLWDADDFEHAGLLRNYLDIKQVMYLRFGCKADEAALSAEGVSG